MHVIPEENVTASTLARFGQPKQNSIFGAAKITKEASITHK